MNNLEAEGTSRKRFLEPGQLLLFSCARTAQRRHRVVQEPERVAAARPTPARGRRGSPRSCLVAGRRWGRRRRAAERLSSKRSVSKTKPGLYALCALRYKRSYSDKSYQLYSSPSSPAAARFFPFPPRRVFFASHGFGEILRAVTWPRSVSDFMYSASITRSGS